MFDEVTTYLNNRYEEAISLHEQMQKAGYSSSSIYYRRASGEYSRLTINGDQAYLLEIDSRLEGVKERKNDIEGNIDKLKERIESLKLKSVIKVDSISGMDELIDKEHRKEQAEKALKNFKKLLRACDLDLKIYSDFRERLVASMVRKRVKEIMDKNYKNFAVSFHKLLVDNPVTFQQFKEIISFREITHPDQYNPFKGGDFFEGGSFEWLGFTNESDIFVKAKSEMGL